ncbi:hypothetical protein like AT5G52975 [Hibiscus trionum]|uniref:Prolamin-like domain-containing protein n=1 Tax=Hibiscus trionum TaxID=183268 RepID=A0A9W7I5G4_HIBTR|nr:hypothetical protein like AT5G52975 [Hibiscus trionum]
MSTPRKPSPVLIISAFMALFVAAGTAQKQLPPFPFMPTPGRGPFQPGEVQKCWSSLTNIQGCVMEITTSFFYGKTGIIGPACCHALAKISNNCWLKMFPFTPLLPPFLRMSCSNPTPPAGPTLNGISKVSIPVSWSSPGYDVGQCWSSLTKVSGCVEEILASLAGGVTGRTISSACCRAVTYCCRNAPPPK